MLLVLFVSLELLHVQFAAEASEEFLQPMKVHPLRGLFPAVLSAWLVGWWHASQETIFNDKKLTISDSFDRQ